MTIVTAKPPSARVSRLTITKLFGTFTHEVSLRREERVTILLGPNGIGKTQLLECTRALFSGDFGHFLKVPFESFSVELDDGTGVIVRSTPESNEVRKFRKRVGRRQPESNWWISLEPTPKQRNIKPWSPHPIITVNAANSPSQGPHFVGENMWYDGEGVLWMHDGTGLSPQMRERPGWFEAFLKRTSVTLIETQRLMNSRGREEKEEPLQILEVDRLAKDAAERIRKVRERYTTEGARLDRTYVRRFIDYTGEVHDTAALQNDLREIDERRARLETLALLSGDSPEHSVSQSLVDSKDKGKGPALSLYAEDMNLKLGVLEPFAKQLELFLSSINRKLRGKEIVAHAEKGLLVRAKTSNLSLEFLSSGEQHELVLLYRLVFEVQRDSLVLIDEPELSLHPLWQEQFLDDLLEIVKEGSFDVLLATHSPYIIGEREDLCTVLKDNTAGA